MFERFTPRARRVIVLAQDLVRDLSHMEIRPEHLLVALAAEGEGVAAQAMAQAGVAVEALRQRVADRLAGQVVAAEVIKPPFTVEAKRALEQSLRAAISLGHNYIGTEHIFMGVEREAEQDGWPLEALLGVSPKAVIQRSLELLRSVSAPGYVSPAYKSAMDRARRRSSSSTTTTGDVLSAILADENSQAARALLGLGVTPDALDAALETIDVDTTSDRTDKRGSITITFGESSRIFTDGGIVDALQNLSAEELRDAIRRAIGLDKPDQVAG